MIESQIRNPKEVYPPAREIRNRPRPFFVAVLGAVAIATLFGCQPKAPVASSKQSQQNQFRQFDRSDALLKAAASQLNDLPAAVDTELRPPAVILDGEKNPDHVDVLAICLANPTMPGNPINVIQVPSGKGHFKGLRVQSGDILKYFVKQDKTVDDDSIASGMSLMLAMDLKIAQVVDDNLLLIEGGLNQQVEIPHKIEIWRSVDTRQREINEKLVLYDTHGRPALAWEPAPDDVVLVQVLAWLNQWSRQSNAPSTWKRDPLIETLDSAITGDEKLKPYLSTEALAAKSFQPHEGRTLQEAVWLRDISRWAHGDDFDDVARASALFDWTTRNIQLVDDGSTAGHRPWHVLLYGRGSAAQRAWVFARLCRQQGLTVVMLGIPAAGDSETDTSSPMYWLPSLLSKGELHLFDPTLGLPIPGPGGKGVATLAQALKDDTLLRALDLEGAPYPVSAERLKTATAYVVADPFELSRRASQLEAMLTGDDHMSLAVKPSEIADQAKAVAGVQGVALWDVPFRTLREQLTLGGEARHREALAFEPFAVRPMLWKARTRHFQGRRKAATEPGGDALNDHQEAIRLYMAARLSDRAIAGSPSVDQRRVETTAKANATYWLGLLSYDDGKFEIATDWFGRPELGEKGSPSQAAAQYNLARSLEAQQKLDEAIPLLEKSASPQQHGDKARASELKSRPAAEKTEKPAE